MSGQCKQSIVGRSKLVSWWKELNENIIDEYEIILFESTMSDLQTYSEESLNNLPHSIRDQDNTSE